MTRACAGLVAGIEPVPALARRLRGTAAGIARPFLLTHTIRCMPTQNSARESLLSPSASEYSQICRKCCADEGSWGCRLAEEIIMYKNNKRRIA